MMTPYVPVSAQIRKVAQLTLLLVGFSCALIVGTLIELMGIRGNHYRNIADENRFFRLQIPADRGIIMDRFGAALIQNTSTYYLATSSAQQLFASRWSLPQIEQQTALQYLAASPSSVITRTERGDVISPSVAHIVGYTGYPQGTGLQSADLRDIRVGKTGVEKTFDDTLRGLSGRQRIEISAAGVPQRFLQIEQEAIDGQHLKLAIDATLSAVAYEALGDFHGSVIVTDVTSNQVLVMTNSPSYTTASLAAALQDPASPLLNRALLGYPPGSTFKLMTALAALKAKAVDRTTQILDEGEIKLGNQVFGNWYWRQYGRTEGKIALERAIARSNDIYFYTIAALIGPEKIDAVASEFGFGRRTGIELPAESVGVLPNSAWKEKRVGEKWYTGDTYNMGIGQGYVLASPAQVNGMTAAIARRGEWCPLTLLPMTDQSCTSADVDKSDIELVINGMVEACSTGGTATPFFPLNETLTDSQKIACKTGTAEFGGSVNEKGHKRTHGWLTMFYPREKPTVAITVLVESTPEKLFVEGSKDAAPIALKVFEAWRGKYESR